MKILVSLVHAPSAEIHIPYDRHYEVSFGPNPYQNPIGHLNDGVILLLRPESLRVLLSSANQCFCYFNLAGITKFIYERKNERYSGCASEMTPSGKWRIRMEFMCKLEILVSNMKYLRYVFLAFLNCLCGHFLKASVKSVPF